MPPILRSNFVTLEFSETKNKVSPAGFNTISWLIVRKLRFCGHHVHQAYAKFLPGTCLTVRSSWWNCRSPWSVGARRSCGRHSRTRWWQQDPWLESADDWQPSKSRFDASPTQSRSRSPTTDRCSFVAHLGEMTLRGHRLSLRPTARKSIDSEQHRIAKCPTHYVNEFIKTHLQHKLYHKIL